MSRAWDYLQRLTRHPHRGPTTAEERAAAQEIRQWLVDLGYTCELEPFDTPSDTLCIGPATVMGGVVAALAVGVFYPWAGLIAGAVFLLPLVGELLGHSWVDLDLLLPSRQSQNVVARSAGGTGTRTGTGTVTGIGTGPGAVTAPGAGGAAGSGRTLVISGHYDTQRATYLFHPRFAPYLREYFLLTYGLLFLAPALLLLAWVWPEAEWIRVLAAADGLLLAANAAFLLVTRAKGGDCPTGTEDHGTGAALTLSLAEHFARFPLKGVHLIFVLTGARAVGTRGMKAFLRQHRFDPATTRFINVDSLYGGRLHYLTGEGILGYQPYGAELLDSVVKLAREQEAEVLPKPNLLLPTDGLIPALAGYQAVSFLALREDGGRSGDCRQTVTPDRVDRNLLDFTEGFLIKLLYHLGKTR